MKTLIDPHRSDYHILTFVHQQSIDTRTGPEISQVFIEDIAHALSQINRYVGHAAKPISVAEHSIYVSELCPLGMYKLYFLLHDAAEYIYQDIPKPVKNLIEDQTLIYDRLSKTCLKTILEAFELSWPKYLELQNDIKAADLELFNLERRMLANGNDLTEDHPLHDAPFGMDWQEAKEEFLNTFKSCTDL